MAYETDTQLNQLIQEPLQLMVVSLVCSLLSALTIAYSQILFPDYYCLGFYYLKMNNSSVAVAYLVLGGAELWWWCKCAGIGQGDLATETYGKETASVCTSGLSGGMLFQTPSNSKNLGVFTFNSTQ